MTSSIGVGFMAAFAVSGSVVLIARQVHKHLVSEFMKEIEFELMGSKRSCPSKKRVRFADDVTEASANNKEYRNKHLLNGKGDGGIIKMEDFINQKQIIYAPNLMETMPENRKILYEGILKYRSLKGCPLSPA